MQIRELNHVALHVVDVERSKHFYGELVGLPPLPRPDFNFPGAWFQLGSGQELHLIGRREAQVHSDPRGNHFALAVDDIDAAAEQLRAAGIEFSGPSARPDGAKQIFFADPDGHFVELCFVP